MTKQTVEEHITLYSPGYREQTGEIDLDQVTMELLQTSRIREYQKLCRVFDDRYLSVTERTPRNTTGFTVPLSLLDAKPAGKWSIRLGYLLFAGLCFALAWTGYTLMQKQTGIFGHPNMYAAITLLATAGAILVVYTIKKSRHVLIFKSKNGRMPVVELLYNNPDKRRFRRFAAQLSALISRCDAQNYFTDSQRLAAELSEHRRLRDEGVLTDAQYEHVKHHILARHSQPAGQGIAETLH